MRDGCRTKMCSARRQTPRARRPRSSSLLHSCFIILPLLPHYGTKGGNCTTHGLQKIFNTITLQTLVETGVGGLFVKYVFMTSAQRTGLFHHSWRLAKPETRVRFPSPAPLDSLRQVPPKHDKPRCLQGFRECLTLHCLRQDATRFDLPRLNSVRVFVYSPAPRPALASS